MTVPRAKRSPSDRFPDPPVHFAPEGIGKFDSMLESIAVQAHVAIFAEGAPLEPLLTDGAHNKLLAALSTGDGIGHLTAVITAVGAAWDYDTVRLDTRTFLLRKRFTDPNDLPFVTYEEAVYDFEGLLKSIAPFNPSIVFPTETDSPLVRCMLNANLRFGADQLGKGIALSEFDPADRQVFIDSAMSWYCGPAAVPAREILAELSAVRNPRAEFRYFDLWGQKIVTVFGFQGPFKYGLHEQKFREFALSHQFTFDVSGLNELPVGYRFFSLTANSAMGKLSAEQQTRIRGILSQIKDPDAPQPADYASHTTSKQTLTLGSLVDRMISHAAKPGLNIAVEPAIAQKPISVFNIDILSPEAVLRAAALLYGLRVQKRPDGVVNLAMRSVQPVNSLGEVGPAIEKMIPEPYLRAYRAGARRETEAAIVEKKREVEESGRKFYDSDRLSIQMSDGPKRSQARLFYAAVHRLRILVEPKVKSAADSCYPMSQMTEEEKRLFALIWIAEFFRGIDSFLQHSDPPQCLRDPSNFYVLGRLPTESRRALGIFMGYMGTDRVHTEAEFEVVLPQK